ncbi:ATP-binding protein [Actinacidiphila soli]|uniref:ATP-binding protein n=1 Tax=Actinacidiphila soli TaxID=2487275 RepID=UPI000FCA871E|nr:ATP-binding protein [Actinacidiphila soli]
MDEYTSKLRVWGLTCPGFPEEVSRARRWTRDILSHSPHADDVALIVSELGANALVHTASGDGTGTFHITLALSDLVIAISVTDSGSGTAPTIEHPGTDATHGRGLGMVAALADNVEIHGDHHGHTITAELLMPHPGVAAC